MLLDGWLAAVAIVQTIVVAVRLGSKVLSTSAIIGVMPMDPDLPRILPPGTGTTGSTEASAALFDLTVAFRQGVKLGLQLEEYKKRKNYRIIDCSALIGKEKKQEEPYRMSMVPASASASVFPDDKEDHPDPYFSTALVTEYTYTYPRTRSSSSNNQNKKTAQITAYLPDCFADLRSYFGIDPVRFQQTFLQQQQHFVSFQSNSKGAARTGGVFFGSPDGAYLIKTIRRDEVQALLQMMPRYARFMKEETKQHHHRHRRRGDAGGAGGRRSLLTRFCGLYRVEILENEHSEHGDSSKRRRRQKQQLKPQYLIIMNSVFPPNVPISERFDLKGSTVGRKVSDTERQQLGSRVVLKDVNLAEEFVEEEEEKPGDAAAAAVASADAREQPDETNPAPSQQPQPQQQPFRHGLCIGPVVKQALLAQLRSDVGLLRECGVIDYSLLVGCVPLSSSVHHRRQQQQQPGRLVQWIVRRIRRWAFLPPRCGVDAGPLSVVPGERRGKPVLYYFGLIDFLQPFNYKKLLEYGVKAVVYEKATYSCVPPDLYAQRFLDFIDKHVT